MRTLDLARRTSTVAAEVECPQRWERRVLEAVCDPG